MLVIFLNCFNTVACFTDLSDIVKKFIISKKICRTHDHAAACSITLEQQSAVHYDFVIYKYLELSSDGGWMVAMVFLGVVWVVTLEYCLSKFESS